MSLRRLASASLANLVIPISGLIISPFLSRELDPEGRGLYAALTLPIVVCGWVGTFGLQDALSFHGRNGQLTGRQAARISAVAMVPLGVVGIALMALLGLFIFEGRPADYRDFLVLALFAPLHIGANLLIGGLTGLSDVRGVNRVKVVPAVLRTGLVVVACLAFDLDAFVAAILFMVTIVPGVVLGLRRLRHEPQAQPEPIAPLPLKSLAVYAIACLPGVLAAVSSARLPQIIGLPVIGSEQLGFYAVAVSVAEIPMVIATAARTILLGRATGDSPAESTFVARLAVAASVLACGFLAAIAVVAVPFVFGQPFAPAVTPTIILCGATVFYTLMVLLTAVLLAEGHARWSSAALVAGSLVTLACIFVFAGAGAIGAAFASAGGYATSVIIAAWALSRSGTPYTLRMLAVPYSHDFAVAWGKLARLRRQPAAKDAG